MYRLITCDLDETLLDDDHRIPERVRRAIAAARERGRVLHPAAQKGWGAPPVFVRRRAKKTLQTGADAL